MIMILKGEKIILRPINKRDILIILGWYNDPLIKKLEFISKKIKKEDILVHNGKNFLISVNNNPVGFINLEINRKNNSADIGILINKNHWSNGYGSDAIKIVINFCFNKLKLNRLSAITYNHNIRAQKLFKNSGFKIEGIKKEVFLYKKVYYDAILMAILRKEWLKSKLYK